MPALNSTKIISFTHIQSDAPLRSIHLWPQTVPRVRPSPSPGGVHREGARNEHTPKVRFLLQSPAPTPAVVDLFINLCADDSAGNSGPGFLLTHALSWTRQAAKFLEGMRSPSVPIICPHIIHMHEEADRAKPRNFPPAGHKAGAEIPISQMCPNVGIWSTERFTQALRKS